MSEDIRSNQTKIKFQKQANGPSTLNWTTIIRCRNVQLIQAVEHKYNSREIK